MAISSDSVLVIQNQFIPSDSTNIQALYSGAVGQSTVEVLGYCDGTTQSETNTISMDAVDKIQGNLGIIVSYFLSTNPNISVLNTIIDAQNASGQSATGTYEDTVQTVILEYGNLEIGDFVFNSINYAYKLTSSAVNSGDYTDMLDTDQLQFNLTLITATAEQVAEQYIGQLENAGTNNIGIFNAYFTQLVSELEQLIPS